MVDKFDGANLALLQIHGNPLPLKQTPPPPLILNTPIMWYVTIYWEYLRGVGGFHMKGRGLLKVVENFFHPPGSAIYCLERQLGGMGEPQQSSVFLVVEPSEIIFLI